MRQNAPQKRGRGRPNGRRPFTNPINRTYDSNGPDVKVRGTAMHIFDKYQALARDASSSGDRIAAENYLQHAEHYYRLMMAAQAQAAANQARQGGPQHGGGQEGRQQGGSVAAEGAEQPPAEGAELVHTNGSSRRMSMDYAEDGEDEDQPGYPAA